MLGVAGSILITIAIIGTAAGEELDTYSGWALPAVAVAVVVTGWLLGLLLVRTVGLAWMGFTLGGLVGAAVAAVRGEWTYVPGFLLVAFAGALVSGGQRYRLANS